MLGFFSTGEVTARGNYGLLDQRLALLWIWDNIREFGGDSARITLIGQRAGARHVAYHVLSAETNGLFQRAVFIGGSPLDPSHPDGNPLPVATLVARRLGCPTSDLVAMVTCVQAAPVAALLSASKGLTFDPVLDRQYIAKDPLILLQRGLFNVVDILLVDAGSPSPEVDLTDGISEPQLRDTLQRIASTYDPRLRELLWTQYFRCASDDAQRGAALSRLERSRRVRAPLERSARFFSRRTKTFVLEFPLEGGFLQLLQRTGVSRGGFAALLNRFLETG